MDFRLIRDYDQFSALKDDWNDLVNRIQSPEIFHCHEWTDSIICTQGKNYFDHLLIVAGYDKGKLVVLMPFLLLGDGTISFINRVLTDYNTILVDLRYNSFSLFKDALDFLLNSAEICRFALDEFQQSPEIFVLMSVLESRGFKVFIKYSNSCAILPKGTGEEKFNKKNYKDVIRRQNRLTEKYSVDFLDDCDLNAELYSFISNQKKETNGFDFMEQQEVRAFFFHLQDLMKGRMVVSALKLDGEYAAMHLGFKTDDKYYYYIPVYRKDFSKLGVGAILLKHLIEQNISKRDFDFLRGGEDYKFDWSDNIRANFSLHAYKMGKSRLAVLKERFKANADIRELLGK